MLGEAMRELAPGCASLVDVGQRQVEDVGETSLQKFQLGRRGENLPLRSIPLWNGERGIFLRVREMID
jgi:hypothetical protein